MTRELQHGGIIAISGVSFRQDAVRQVRAGDRILLIADPSNPYDAGAIAAATTDGTLVGYVPKALTPRMHVTGATTFDAEVSEVLDRETVGLRVRYLGPSDVEATAPGDVPRAAASPAPPREPAAPPSGRKVRNRAGRLLGTYVGESGSDILVDVGGGTTVPYPAVICEMR